MTARNEAEAIAPTLMFIGGDARGSANGTFIDAAAAEILDRLRAWTGSEVSLPELNGAQRQRRMIAAGATPAEVYAECVRDTQATYLQETCDEPAA